MLRGFPHRPAGRFGRCAALLLLCVSCGNPTPAEEAASKQKGAAQGAARASAEAGDAVKPPFAVRGELEGLLLVWFDQQGTHTASRRSDIPEASRARVRVEALNIAPSQRLDPEHVYVADLARPAGDGSYAVRVHTRGWFDAQVDAARPAPAPLEQASASGGVTIYKASWCGACKATAAYLRSRNVPFVEKDIEKDAEANAEMLRKAHAAGKQPSGIPVIDFRGQIILGFDQATLDRLINSSGNSNKPI
jgi:glutaredoxin